MIFLSNYGIILIDLVLKKTRLVLFFIRGISDMLKEEKFNFDIENMKKDFAIENMTISSDEIDMLKKYNNSELSMNEMIKSIKQSFEV